MLHEMAKPYCLLTFIACTRKKHIIREEHYKHYQKRFFIDENVKTLIQDENNQWEQRKKEFSRIIKVTLGYTPKQLSFLLKW